MPETVVITGLGTVGGYGCGADRLRSDLASSTLRRSEVDRSAGYHLTTGARTASLVDASGLSAWVAPGVARRMSPPSKFAVAASRMALCQSGLEGKESAPGSTAVVLSTAFGPASFTEKLLKSILLEGPELASPFLFTECVANAPAAQLAIACRATGPNITIVQREAGPLLAVARGAAEVASGRVARALVGAVDEMPPVLHAILDRFGALVRGGEDGFETPRPLDRHRTGFLAGEGATVLVLEAEAAASRRGAPILARVRCWGSAFDPTASRVGWGRGHGFLAKALVATLRRVTLEPGQFDRIVSGASGSPRGDRLEAKTLTAAWDGTALPPLVAPKSITGEYGGGFLAAAVLAAAGADFGPTPGFVEADPELGLAPHTGDTLPPPSRTLVSSLAAGGAASFLVLERA